MDKELIIDVIVTAAFAVVTIACIVTLFLMPLTY